MRSALVVIMLMATACAADEVDLSSADLVVDAHDHHFGTDRLDVDYDAGGVTIGYRQLGRAHHTLRVERDSRDLGVRLSVGAGTGDSDLATIDLSPGSYVVYCDVPGHRAAGMQADLVVHADNEGGSS